MDELIRRDPNADDLTSFVTGKDESIGIVNAGKVAEHSFTDIFSAEGARAIAGAAAVRDWKLIDTLTEQLDAGKKSDVLFSQAYKGTRKSPSAIVLAHIARLYGVAEPWTVAMGDLWQKLRLASQEFWRGSWESALESLLSQSQSILEDQGGCVDHLKEYQITEARYENEMWKLQTTKGQLQAQRLLIAQSPWEAGFWLPRPMWPQKLLAATNKTKPTSVVVLADRRLPTEQTLTLPDRSLIPAEDTQVLIDKDAIYFQATLEYELTLRAPDVVKAVKRLRRSRKKFLAVYPDISLEGDHIALLPVAWSPPLSLHDRRLLNRLNFDKMMMSHLAFCGETYGDSVCGDENLKNSIQSATKALLNEKDAKK
jgi:hypothetical protein